jgi:hypothetical protein
MAYNLASLHNRNQYWSRTFKYRAHVAAKMTETEFGHVDQFHRSCVVTI